MRAVIQRVNSAELKVDGKIVASIGKGIVVFVGFNNEDTNKSTSWLANKVSGLRIFEDENNKMNLNVTQVNGEVLIVPNFTLYGDCSQGFRPCFTYTLKPEAALVKFNEFVSFVNEKLKIKAKTGIFGADMQIVQHNDGPITMVLEH